jgi:circadian clock protein KaiB
METKNGQDEEEAPYVLRLFVTGASANSLRAITNMKALCAKHLPTAVLEIIDVYQEPGIAEREQIIALPMLVRLAPLPERRMIGDMSDTGKVLYALGIHFNAPGK